MKKCDRVYVPHPNFRFPTEPLYRIAQEIIYVCDTPMFDDMIAADHKHKFEGMVAKKMEDFDPETDAIAFYGDAIIFAMMVITAYERSDIIRIARYSQKLDEYVIREIDVDENWYEYE
jgi:hypothetical protein